MFKRTKSIGAAAAIAMTWAATTFGAEIGSYPSVVEHLSVSKNTQLHVREYWKSSQGQEASWSAEVIDVQGGRKGRVKILAADKSQPTYKGYNIVLVTTDVAKAADMKRGQKIRFKGILKEYAAKNSAVVVELSDVQIL
jgi:hypothetical protein